MLLISSSETRRPAKTPSFAVIWTKGLERPEIVNTTVGKPENGVSKVCKQQFILRFAKLVPMISSISGIQSIPPTYAECKATVINYNVRIHFEIMIVVLMVFL